MAATPTSPVLHLPRGRLPTGSWSSTVPWAPTSSCRTSPPTTSAAPTSRAATSCWCVTRPDVIDRVHRSFFEVGCDVVETDTFGAFAPVLAEYGQGHRVRELNLAAATLAREAADDFSTPDRPRWVAGSIGPGTKFPTLGQIRYADLRDAYQEQAAALIEGGVDLIIIETVFDLLQAKAAINGARRAMRAAGVHLPIQTQVTIELTGTHAAGHRDRRRPVRPARPWTSTSSGSTAPPGPARCSNRSATCPAHATLPVTCLPNAGLPSVVDGAMHYDLTPDQLAEFHRQFVTELGRLGHRRVLRDHPRAPGRGGGGLRRPHAGGPRTPSPSTERRPSTPRSPSSRTPPSWWSASGPTPTDRRSSARPCSRPTGTPAWPWPASRSRRAPTSSTCASTTPAPTAWPTWRRWPPASPPSPPRP